MKLMIGASSGGLGARVVLVASSHGRSHLRAGGASQTNFSSPFSSSSSAGVSQTVSSSLQSSETEDAFPGRRIAAEDNPFVKPLSNVYHVLPCRFCKGSKEVKCKVCDGQGSLARGGFHKRNPISIDRIVGSKWTAMETTFGWRHFHVNSKRKGPQKDWFIEMVSTCDNTTQFWINAKNLKDRDRWSAGWLQKEELIGMKENAVTAATICKACKGRQTVVCHPCANKDRSVQQSPALDIIDV